MTVTRVALLNELFFDGDGVGDCQDEINQTIRKLEKNLGEIDVVSIEFPK